VFLSSCATNTSFNSFYQKNQKEAEFSMGLSSSLIRPFLSGEDYEEVKPLLKKAKHIRILVFSENYEEKYTKFNKFIKKSDFDKLVKIKEDDEQISFYTLENKNKIKEVVLQINSDDELVLLGLKTNLTQEDLDNFVQ
jgi:isocitrate dehydrogenase